MSRLFYLPSAEIPAVSVYLKMSVVCVCVGDNGATVTQPTASYPRLQQTRGKRLFGPAVACVSRACGIVHVWLTMFPHQAPLQLHAIMMALDVFHEQHNRPPNTG